MQYLLTIKNKLQIKTDEVYKKIIIVHFQWYFYDYSRNHASYQNIVLCKLVDRITSNSSSTRTSPCVQEDKNQGIKEKKSLSFLNVNMFENFKNLLLLLRCF